MHRNSCEFSDKDRSAMNSKNEPSSAGESSISLLTGFARGFAAPLDGLLFMRKHPALWQYGLMPMVINLVISGIVILAAAYGVWYAAGQLEGVFPEGWLGQVGYYASLIGLVLLAVMLAFGFWTSCRVCCAESITRS
jgi:hypothetical protein